MRTYDKKELAIILADTFDFLDNRKKLTIAESIANGISLKDALLSMKGDLLEEGLVDKAISCLNKDYLQSALDLLDKYGVTAITVFSKDYPEELKNIFSPPAILYAKGNLELLKTPNRFAIVGSRKSLPQDKTVAENYAKVLTENGMCIVTGIAEGVDEHAIKGALNSGKIISVTAGGFDKVYPKSNDELFSSVAKNGLCLSEQRPTVESIAYMYPLRNRIIAGLSVGVLVVSAGVKSGTFHTVNYALDGGKDIFAIPHAIGVQCGEGTNKLIKSGAFLTDEPNDILSYYGLEVEKEETKKVEELSAVEQPVYDKIKESGSIYIEKLAELLNKRSFELLPILSMLEIKGLIIKSADNFYTCV